MSMLEFAGPSTSSTVPQPQFDPARPKQADKTAERSFLLGQHDLSHVDSKSFAQLFRQGLGNILVSRLEVLINMATVLSYLVGHCLYCRSNVFC